MNEQKIPIAGVNPKRWGFQSLPLSSSWFEASSLKKLLVVLIIVRDDIQVFCNFYKPVFDFFTQS